MWPTNNISCIYFIDSLFIRAGYPAFGLMNAIYSQKEKLREMRQLLEKQSSVLQNAEQLRKEFKNTSTISENIKVYHFHICRLKAFFFSCVIIGY